MVYITALEEQKIWLETWSILNFKSMTSKRQKNNYFE